MTELVDWEPNNNYKVIKSNIPGKIIMNEQTKAFMKFFNEEYGVKFFDEETGKEIKVNESKPNPKN